MLSTNFNSKRLASIESDFLLDLQYFTHKVEPVHLIACRFDVERYQPSLFQELGVFLPEQISRSVTKRQAEFLVGRFLAKRAMQMSNFGQETQPTLHIGEQRGPVWPKEIVGSITHTNQSASCVVGDSERIRLIGLDQENILDTKTAADIGNQVHTKAELKLLTDQGLASNIATTLMFSAKESLFKAYCPTVQRYFGFECATVIEANRDSRTLCLELSNELSDSCYFERTVICHYDIQQSHLATFIVGT